MKIEEEVAEVDEWEFALPKPCGDGQHLDGKIANCPCSNTAK